MPVITIEGPPRNKETKRKLVKQFTAIFKEFFIELSYRVKNIFRKSKR